MALQCIRKWTLAHVFKTMKLGRELSILLLPLNLSGEVEKTAFRRIIEGACLQSARSGGSSVFIYVHFMWILSIPTASSPKAFGLNTACLFWIEKSCYNM